MGRKKYFNTKAQRTLSFTKVKLIGLQSLCFFEPLCLSGMFMFKILSCELT